MGIQPANISSNLAQRRRWAYVAAFGATWGALEITVGSFLHTLHLPFTGTILAAVGVIILVAERQILPARGITLATGLVAALCKSLSPGGAIFGPMLGITVEALLVEIALLVAPRGIFSALLAGGLTTGWTFGQKLLTQYILYGGDIISLYLGILRRGADGLHLSAKTGYLALGIILGIPLLLGAGAGFLGWRIGRRSRQRIDRELRP